MKKTSQRSLLFRQNVNRTVADRRRVCPRQGGRGMRTRLRPRRRAMDRAAMRSNRNHFRQLALRRKVAGDVRVVGSRSLKMVGHGFAWIEYKHRFPKFAAERLNCPCLIGIACYQNKAVGIRAHGIDECCDSKVYVRTLLFKLYNMRHSRVGFFADLAFLADMGKPRLLFAVKSFDDFYSAKGNESLEIYFLPFLGCDVMWICADTSREVLYGEDFMFFLEHCVGKCAKVEPFTALRSSQQAIVEIVAVYVNNCLFHFSHKMQGASTFRLKPPRRIGRASRVEYNPLTGSVGIIPNIISWRNGVWRRNRIMEAA